MSVHLDANIAYGWIMPEEHVIEDQHEHFRLDNGMPGLLDWGFAGHWDGDMRNVLHARGSLRRVEYGARELGQELPLDEHLQELMEAEVDRLGIKLETAPQWVLWVTGG